eukprot:2204543-Prymnesium_polylepis.1
MARRLAHVICSPGPGEQCLSANTYQRTRPVSPSSAVSFLHRRRLQGTAGDGARPLRLSARDRGDVR